ncbi:FHA domain-containing protein [Planctomycetota bacterium]|nr:FHA domain-containing protein [Planctomycetota bacterium]
MMDIELLGTFRATHAATSREEFVGLVGTPYLVTLTASERMITATGMTWQDGGDAPPLVSVDESAAAIYPLVKCRSMGLPTMITIGRALNNDVILADPTVSNFHAYFQEAEGWSLFDGGSRHGTFVRGERLDKGTAAGLNSGETIQLGSAATLLFLEPDAFYEWLNADS